MSVHDARQMNKRFRSGVGEDTVKRMRPRKSGKKPIQYETEFWLREYGPAAVKTLYNIMIDEDETSSVRVTCAKELANRAYGTAAHKVDVEGNIQVDINVAYLDALKDINEKVTKVVEAQTDEDGIEETYTDSIEIIEDKFSTSAKE